MAESFVIRAEQLGKKYIISHERTQRYVALRDVLTERARAVGRRLRSPLAPTVDDRREEVWALKDVSFEVQRGERLGIIGRNGAGKSTLLKLLSRITEPSSGRVRIRGRIASLLEVGTGFHPELTGRENIYLNGIILGMSRGEVQRRFDEIVAFAEVERFLDTPVKRYSSGMYMRLAFAVAAHLEPEILLVDEVLAVGDVDFQKKCIGAMEASANSGRTILLVSHNLGVIEALCNRSILLERGHLASNGPTPNVIAAYRSHAKDWETEDLRTFPRQRLPIQALFTSVHLTDQAGNTTREIAMGGDLSISCHIEATQTIVKPWIGIQIRTPLDQLIFHAANREAGYELPPLQGQCAVVCHMKALNLLPGRYAISLILADMSHNLYDEVVGASYFDVMPKDVFNSGALMEAAHGSVFFESRWTLE